MPAARQLAFLLVVIAVLLLSLACGAGGRVTSAQLAVLPQPTPDPTLDAVIRGLPGARPTATPAPTPTPKPTPKPQR